MIRIVAFSDSHGEEEALERCVRHALTGMKPYAAIFLGDGARDFERIHPLLYQCGVHAYQIAGNNDRFCPYEKEFTVNVGNTVIYACHGHLRHVKLSLDSLCYAAQEKGASAALYGHTHMASLKNESGLILMNPGAVCDCDPDEVRYCELIVKDNGELLPKLIHQYVRSFMP